MHVRILIAGLAMAVLALNGCGGRTARPVTVTQSFDSGMSCAQLASELEANKVRINSLHKEDADRHGRNAAMATAGVLLVGVGALFFIDTGEAQEKEIQAYTARNNHLTQVASTKGCTDEEMAAAVAANSAYAAAAATTAASGSPAQVAVATASNAQASQAQAQFDAWYAANSEDLRRAITNEMRSRDRPVNCIAGTRPTELVTIVDTTVLSRDDSGYRVNVQFYKASEASCTGTRNDAFLIRIENDQIAEVSYLGPAASLPAAVAATPAAAASGTSTVASVPQPAPGATDLAAAQQQFDAWYAGNSETFAERMNIYAHQRGLVSFDCGQRAVRITAIRVTGLSADGYEATISIWKQGNWTNCEVQRTDSYAIRIENDELIEIDHRGPA